MNQRRETIVVVFCWSEPVALTISNVANQIQTFDRQIFFIFSLNVEKWEEKMVHQKKNTGSWTSNIAKYRQS